MNVIDACNRSCSFCPRSDKINYPDHPHARMSADGAIRLSLTMAAMEFKGVFSITGWGEPLLHKNLEQVVIALKQENPEAKVEVQTNGDMLLTTRIHGLYEAGLDKLVINLYDGPEQAERFEHIMQLCKMPDTFWTMQHKYDKNKTYGMVLNNRAGSFQGLPGLQSPLEKPCYMPFYKIAVDWNLDVYFCDYDWAKRILLGNLCKTDMQDLWMSDKMKEIRLSLYNGNRQFAPCKYCDAEGTLYGKKQADTIMSFYENNQ